MATSHTQRVPTDEKKRKSSDPDRHLQVKKKKCSHRIDASNQRGDSDGNTQQVEHCQTRLKCPYYQQNPSRYQKKSCRDVTYDTMRGIKWHLERVHTKAPDCGCCNGSSACPKMLSKLRGINLNRAPFAREDPVAKWGLLFKELFNAEDVLPLPYEEKGLSNEEQEQFFAALTEALMRNLGPVFGLQYETLSRIVAECRRDARYIHQQGQGKPYHLRDETLQRVQQTPSFPPESFDLSEGIQSTPSQEDQVMGHYVVGNSPHMQCNAGPEKESRILHPFAEPHLSGTSNGTCAASDCLANTMPQNLPIYDTSALQAGPELAANTTENQTPRIFQSNDQLMQSMDPPFPASSFDINVDVDVDDLIFQFLTQDVFQSSPAEPFTEPPLQASAMATSSPGLWGGASLDSPRGSEPRCGETRGPIARLLGLG